ncbi:MAG: gas vesicle protein GvpG [Acidobacteriota bacterium]
MLLIDDLLLAPGKALLFVVEEIAKTADKELFDDEAVRQQLQLLYMHLETGRISEREFDEREQALVRRLEMIERRKTGSP